MADYGITAVTRRVVYSGSAGTGPYNFSFPVLVQTDLAVYKDTTLLTLTTDYTVTLSATTGTGSVTLGSSASSANTITIVGARSIERSTDFATGGDFLASSINTELDSQTIFNQQVAEDAGRSIKAPVYDPTTVNMNLPKVSDRASKLMSFDASGNPTVTGTDTLSLATLQAFTNYKTDVFSGNASTQAFTLSASPGGTTNTWVFIDGVFQQASTYTVAGTTLTFGTAPPAGSSNIEVKHGTAAATFVPVADSVSGDGIHGGTISNFASTGIDDNASSTAITIDSSQNVKLGTDGVALAFGADGEIVLTHVHNVGLRIEDNDKMLFGTGADLEIFHDSSHSYIKDVGIGDLYIQGSNTVYVKSGDGGETMASFGDDGAVTLYYDNAAKLATVTGGVTVTGVLTTTGNIELGHASDTTIARSGSGDITIEGNAIYRAGGTDVPVADGGTGVSSLTDGGLLLGSGTGAITAMSALSDGEMIVGDGTTDPVAESGATLRTSIGIGTGNSPQFTGIELGHATDTTITRSGSGDVAIEGNAIYRAGGTDVPVADGGTGASTLTDGGVLLGSGTGAITPMAVLSDGEMIVGDGSTDPGAESGATLRTSIGVGTGDSPQLTAVNIGHATDTTLARSGSGDLTIEGNAIYRAGGTDVPVADGGTGASSLTDGGVLLGSGTGAITPMAVLSDGEMIVGDGSTDPVAESGATLRTSIGVGTGDSPQFTGIELGHASDTTIARSGSGAVTIEGVGIATATNSMTLSSKTLTSPVLNTSVSGTGVKDEDNMASDSATHLATQQSIKAYVDANAGGGSGSADNLVINGCMRVAQRGGSHATLTATTSTLDRWEWIDSGTTAGVVTITQDTDTPTVAEADFNFMNSLKIDVTTAETLGSADAALYLSQKIEAQDCTLFGHGASGALSATLSFWIKSTKIGIFCVNVDRNDASEKYTSEFTIGTTNTWEKKTVTIPGDTGGTAVADDNGIGLAIQFMMSVGGDGDTATKDAWNASGATELATSSQVNLLDNTSNNVLITGVQYEVGSSATAFMVRSYQEELELCMRYAHWLYINTAYQPFCTVYAASTTQVRGEYTYPVIMRTAPSTSDSNPTSLAVTYAAGAQTVLSALVTEREGTTSMAVIGTIGSADLTDNEGCYIRSGGATNAIVKMEAEL